MASVSAAISSADGTASGYFLSLKSNLEISDLVLFLFILIKLRSARFFRILFALGFNISILRISISTNFHKDT